MTLTKPAVETAQDEFELAQLLKIVRDLNPMRILEIGTWHGGTLWEWLQIADTVVAVDNLMMARGEWERWARWADTDLHLIHGTSTDQAIVDAVASHGPYEFVFIDADHTYQSVKADWDTYWPMVTEGGIVAFHDIQPRAQYGVDQLWGELKTSGFKTMEIWGGTPNYCGIGVLWR